MSIRKYLNGKDWRYKSFVGEDWLWRGSHQPESGDRRQWHTGQVPGSVQYDLWQDGLIPDPYFEQNTLQIEWTAQRSWLYKKTFSVDPDLKGKRLYLVFEGVDYAARFYLNGNLLGEHANMFTPARFEVSDQLWFDRENTLSVILEPAPNEQPQVGYTSKVRTMKSRMNYWWDFCPRLIHLGIWDDVYLEASGPIRLEDVFVHPQLSQDYSQALISVAIQASTSQSVPVEVEIDILRFSEVIASWRGQANLVPEENRLSFSLDIEQPELWWPNGYGDQPLYEAQVRIYAPDGALSDQRQVRFGIRKVEFLPNEGASPSARPYTLFVNGRRIYMKGWNWVPMDVLYGVERPAKLNRLLNLVRDAHVNLLRVWGGGLIEREDFYDLCDELGILIWQEFTQSSSGMDNTPSLDPEWINWFVEQARQIIPHKRNHASLLLWCGGNELQHKRETPLDDGYYGKYTHPLLVALSNLVRELDPSRLWLPTSSSGPVFSNSLENIAQDPLSLHDVHGPWEYMGLQDHQTLYNQGTSLLHSEFGVEGITNQKVLQRVIDPKHHTPVDLDNPYWYHLGSWWVKKLAWQRAFGEEEDVERLTRATQWLQYEGLRYALEANRRRKYRNSGSLPWQFNEPYPMAASTSAVDYTAQPKPVYYGVKKAYEPLHISARYDRQAWHGHALFAASLWASNSQHIQYPNVALQASLIDQRGKMIARQEEEVEVLADASTYLLDLSASLENLQTPVFFLDLRLVSTSGEVLSTNRYPFTCTENLSPLLSLPATTLDIQWVDQGDCWDITLTNTGDQVAFGLWLQDESPARDLPMGLAETKGFVYFDDNYLTLLPGERRTLTARWEDISPTERRLSVSGWNIDLQWIQSE